MLALQESRPARHCSPARLELGAERDVFLVAKSCCREQLFAARAASGTAEPALSQHRAACTHCREVQPSEQSPSARQLGPILSTERGILHPEHGPQGSRWGAGAGWRVVLCVGHVPILFPARHPREVSHSHCSLRGTGAEQKCYLLYLVALKHWGCSQRLQTAQERGAAAP